MKWSDPHHEWMPPSPNGENDGPLHAPTNDNGHNWSLLLNLGIGDFPILERARLSNEQMDAMMRLELGPNPDAQAIRTWLEDLARQFGWKG
jgi:hypothetical protein